MITIRTLGPVEVLVDGGPAPAELLWRKHLALLVYLARSAGRSRSREHLTGLLWSEKPEAAARHSLNEALRILRRCCGENAVEASAQQLRLSEAAFSIDTAEFEAGFQGQDWAGAAGLVFGEFMEGFAVPGEWAFEEWLALERRHWTERSVIALVNHAEERLSSGDVDAGVASSAWALRLDPASEAACRSAMRARALSGDRTGALALFETFTRRLRDDVGIEPTAETRALAERVRTGSGLAAAGRTAKRETKGAESKRAPLVERQDSLATIVSAWSASRSGAGSRVVIIDAEPGCGRTRLLQEAVERARLDGALAAVLRAVEGDETAHWSGLVGLIRSGLGSAPGVENAPAVVRSSLARLLSASGRGGAPDEQDGGTPAAAFSELLRAVLPHGPVVLAVDDAHWLDTESLHALGAALRDLPAAPLFLLLTVPSNHAVPAIDETRARIGRDLHGESIRLEPIGGEGLRALARWALPGFGPVDVDRVARRLATDSAGLPLLAVELLHAIALGLEYDPAKSAWPAPLRTLDQTMPADLPDTITSAIRVGFRRLSADAQTVLAAASVLPLRVEPGLIARVTSVSGAALDEALDELEWSRWLTAEPRGYSFVARIVREVIARDMLTTGQRRRILEAAATA